MSDIVIRVENLSKKYVIGRQERNATGRGLRHAIQDAVSRPFQKLRTAFSFPPATANSSPARRAEDFYALRDVSFEVKRGEILGVIGRNGAGKSTLLKLLSRITEPTTGRIGLKGRTASLLEVGTGFHPELTGRENVFLNGAILGMSRSEVKRKFDAIVDFSEVEKFIDTPVKQYSSGMYVRLAFAVAAHLEPEILIVDEVLAVGDAEFQRKCIGQMSMAAGSGNTVIFVSHDTAAIRSLCSKCLLLRDGRLAFQGEAPEAISCYGSQHSSGLRDIKSFITLCHPAFAVDRITVNGSEANEVILFAGNRSLEISVEGSLSQVLRADLEIWLTDQSDMPLAYYSNAHNTGVTGVLPSGPFRIRRRFELPDNVNRGIYLLRITLTDHNVQGWVDCPRSVRISVEGAATATGGALEYQSGKGFIFLREVRAKC